MKDKFYGNSNNETPLSQLLDKLSTELPLSKGALIGELLGALSCGLDIDRMPDFLMVTHKAKATGMTSNYIATMKDFNVYRNRKAIVLWERK